jgi:hypothetical protein
MKESNGHGEVEPTVVIGKLFEINDFNHLTGAAIEGLN